MNAATDVGWLSRTAVAITWRAAPANTRRRLWSYTAAVVIVECYRNTPKKTFITVTVMANTRAALTYRRYLAVVMVGITHVGHCQHADIRHAARVKTQRPD